MKFPNDSSPAFWKWLPSLCLLTSGVALLISSCGDRTSPADKREAEPAATGGVVVANYPLAFFAEYLLQGDPSVTFSAPQDEDPAFWEPDDQAIAEFQAARLILLNGAGYSKWVDRVSLPKSRVVDTSAAFAVRFIEQKDLVTHSHGPEGQHSHGGTAFTTWIDLEQATLQLDAILKAVLPLVAEERRASVTLRADELKQKLAGLDQRLLEVGKKLAGRALLGSHPVYQYLARRYVLDIQAVHWEPDVMPDADALAQLDELLPEHPARVMLWEGEPLPESVALLQAKGISSIVFDPCGNRPDQGDFLQVMDRNVRALETWVQELKR
jgi:zinc transport system substrate-binding protein